MKTTLILSALACFRAATAAEMTEPVAPCTPAKAASSLPEIAFTKSCTKDSGSPAESASLETYLRILGPRLSDMAALYFVDGSEKCGRDPSASDCQCRGGCDKSMRRRKLYAANDEDQRRAEPNAG